MTTLSGSDLIKQFAVRHSEYQLAKKSPIPNEQIVKLVKEVFELTPSAFNTQSTRAIILFGARHDKFWSIIRNAIDGAMKDAPEDKRSQSLGRVDGFAAGYGTVLWLEDPHAFDHLMSLPYVPKYPAWREHTSGMHQLLTWTAFTADGLGCNLQHYDGLTDEAIYKEFDIPKEWELRAQLVFGTPASGTKAHAQVQDISKRVLVQE